MRKYNVFRISCIALLWLFCAGTLIWSKGGIDGQVLFAIIASGIIVFVPLYKQWKRESKNN
ncbi:hypothetical protein [Barnesiella sp. An55]|uniref:hypothetical protein n=1 Tax=Barnesiella sp. An55 TaxID=1965646 RepID=UPI000B3978BA|nr:hypothetical protein [Barnesiella sp. An55]OUN72825.1 hypothetical protein B5G10_06555 [Barnesiella sp. An55]HIZ27397.1 hypothetical protein [Candidatus Barnesiella merdipullorum]